MKIIFNVAIFGILTQPTTMSFKKSIINARIGGRGGSSGPETVKTYIGNVCYVLKSVLNDLPGSAVAQALAPDLGGGSRGR